MNQECTVYSHVCLCYRANDHFSPHIDGPWVPHEDESSVFTVVIYLNSDFKGGSTKFISEEKQGDFDVLCLLLKARVFASIQTVCYVQ